MLDTPFFATLKAQSLSTAHLLAFFGDYYSIVKTSYRMLALGIVANPTRDTATLQHLANFLHTEAGGPVSHIEYYHRWVAEFDISLEALESWAPSQGARRFQTTLEGYFRRPVALDLLAVQLAVEDCAEALIAGLAAGFRKYEHSARGYGYLAAHILIENDEHGHSRWAMDALLKHGASAQSIQRLEAVYVAVYDAFMGVFDGVYARWLRLTPELQRA